MSEEPGNPQATAFASAQSTALIGVAPVSGATININEGNAVPGGTQVATFTDSNAAATANSFLIELDRRAAALSHIVRSRARLGATPPRPAARAARRP